MVSDNDIVIKEELRLELPSIKSEEDKEETISSKTATT